MTTAGNKPKYRIHRHGTRWYVAGFSRQSGLYVVPNTLGTRVEAIRALRAIKAGQGVDR